MGKQPRALSAWQMMLVMIIMLVGSFSGAAWLIDQLILDCTEQQQVKEKENGKKKL
jgi:hypothetical protein